LLQQTTSMKKYFVAAFLFCTLHSLAQNKNQKIYTDRYKLSLPSEWMKKRKLLLAITEILPATLTELSDKKICTDCNTNYTVTLLIDSAIIETMVFKEDASLPPGSMLQSHQCLTTYRFSSALRLSDTLGKTVDVLIIQPKKEFTVTRRYNLPTMAIPAASNAPSSTLNPSYTAAGGEKVKNVNAITSKEYADKNPNLFNPTLNELMNETENGIYSLLKIVRKLAVK
jgi:hypothetical protein